ncbi:hypothetical protein MLGJGCBP_04735 [Rhodococcus sp. T7]|nr:hypothetical protein MLGJGCBP_09247 [Rhodococcus sp. T7]KAF0962114.1 hypothetical protein MLGJGCBP_04735 [Rhodococcus sp. T7]
MVLKLVDEAGLEPNEDERKWDHMGALITDAALQPRTRYTTTVRPRARRVYDEWPDARTTAGFRARLDSEDLPTYLRWRSSSPKITKIYDLVSVMEDLGIDTVDELSARFREPVQEQETRRALRCVKHVGPKTLDYIAILTGSNKHIAVDQHIAAFVRGAGSRVKSYDQVAAVVRAAAAELSCSPGALDAAIWNYMSAQSGR